VVLMKYDPKEKEQIRKEMRKLRVKLALINGR
jgi:hypothetical protein